MRSHSLHLTPIVTWSCPFRTLITSSATMLSARQRSLSNLLNRESTYQTLRPAMRLVLQVLVSTSNRPKSADSER
jgi:hypothetical protein